MSNDPSITEQVNDNNIYSVRKQIISKINYLPHVGTLNGASSVLTDMDHFPYTRFYRGVPSSSQPVMFEREAGWRPQRESCYKLHKIQEQDPYPNHCFESACSTVYPCYPPYLEKRSDRSALNVQLNRSCIVQYR